jgi:3-oxoacyl-[acyl-carrier protein] reductase
LAKEIPIHQDLKRIALVTGASSGIGRAVAVRLARDGFHVLVHYHSSASGAEATAAAIVAENGTCDRIPFNIRNGTDVQKALDAYFKTGSEGRPLAVLINNAGMHADALTGLMSDTQFHDVMETNVYGAFYVTRWAVRRMIRQRFGCIVNVASLAGQTGNPGQINYAASKAALIAMTKSLSWEVASRGIRVNAVAPGLIETPMLDGLPLEKFKERIPMGRLGTSDEVAGPISFLCSPDAAYITGHTLSVNGGLFPS